MFYNVIAILNKGELPTGTVLFSGWSGLVSEAVLTTRALPSQLDLHLLEKEMRLAITRRLRTKIILYFMAINLKINLFSIPAPALSRNFHSWM